MTGTDAATCHNCAGTGMIRAHVCDQCHGTGRAQYVQRADVTEAKPATDAMIESDRAVYGAVLGHNVARYIARIDAERAARLAAEAQLWKPGDPRCDACDNGIANAWTYCAWCGTALKEPANG